MWQLALGKLLVVLMQQLIFCTDSCSPVLQAYPLPGALKVALAKVLLRLLLLLVLLLHRNFLLSCPSTMSRCRLSGCILLAAAGAGFAAAARHKPSRS